ncbi:uncharacterized protein LOC108743791 [Agrilus planipennis]|nr:uncharacterized protein LOC108743791 [Agrilus planipennis]
MTKTILGYQTGFPRPFWSDGGFYNTNPSVDSLYGRATQRSTINSILGLNSNDTRYIQPTNNFFLTRGHFAAKADFIFGAQHRLTFYFVNAAPQFQTFNGGNWNTLENNVRSFSANRQLDLVIYTGGHGVTSLPDVNGNQQDLYLYKDSNNNYAISVPRLYWKVLYEPENKTAIAFVGVNNPYQLIREKDILCTNICSQVNWLTWKANDNTLGYSYCCDVRELRGNVTNIPNFTVNGILL